MAHERVDDWLRTYPQIAAAHHDADGRPPSHTFCYPWDGYSPWEFERLVELCAGGWGEIEVHLHHRDDTATSLSSKLSSAVRAYRDAGALSEWPDGRAAFGFVHGDWALDNSRSDGGRTWCGVNNELDVLIAEGCYADFTFPAWRHTSQPRQVNSIFYAIDDPIRPKSHDTGRRAAVGQVDSAGLLIIQGPLVPFVRAGGRRIKIAMDDGDLASYRRYSPERLDRWVRAGISVRGRPDRVFIKLHTHGAPDANRQALLYGDLEAFFSDAEARYNDGRNYALHYVSAREMFNVVMATVTEPEMQPHEARDFVLPRPRFLRK